MTNIDKWDKEAKYVIMDDIEFEFMPNKKQWWGAQREFEMTDKYRKKITIQFGKPLLFLCNPDQDPRSSRSWSQWYLDNSVIIELETSLF